MSEHVKAQLGRFVRISVLAFLAALAGTGGDVSWSSLWALGAGALEVGWREAFPVKLLPKVASVLSPAAGSGLGLPEIPPGVVESTPRWAPPDPTGTPMLEVKGEVGKTVTISNQAPSEPPGGGKASP